MAMKDFSKVHVLVDLNCSHTFERAGGLADRRSFCSSFAAAVVEIRVTRSRQSKNQIWQESNES